MQGEITTGQGVFAEYTVNNVDCEQAIAAFIGSDVNICRQGLTGSDHLEQVFYDFHTPSALVKRYKKAKKRASGVQHFCKKMP